MSTDLSREPLDNLSRQYEYQYTDNYYTKTNARVKLSVGLVIVLFVVTMAQIFNIQIIQGETLAAQGKSIRTAYSTISAQRGTIVDSNGQVLAESIVTYHIAVNQINILQYKHYENGVLVGTGPAEAAVQLTDLLEINVAELGGKMIGESTYVYLKKNVSQATYRKIKALGIYGIEWESSYERIYPFGNTAATVIGSIDYEGNGNSGLELTFNDELTGKEGKESYEVDSSGAVIPGTSQIYEEASSGETIHTTINIDLQHFAQNYLDDAVSKYGAQWGSIVILDVETSQVLVLADSNEAEAGTVQYSNTIQSVFEPGSVGKLLTFATLFEQGLSSPQSYYWVPDTYTTADGDVITDLHNHSTYLRTSAGIIIESSNTGTVIAGLSVSDEDRYETMLGFGLGKLTGIELPGESAGLLYSYDQWYGRTKYTTMFGQGYAITALQEAALVAAIGNGGLYQSPTIIAGTSDANGIYTASAPKEATRVISEDTAKELLTIMESVTQDKTYGTGQAANLEGYRTAVKTGTAENSSGGTVATVAGVVNADDPTLAIAVVLYEPTAATLSSDTAAPLFHDIAAEAVRILGIPASSEASQLYSVTP